jgi:signal peptidase I
MMYFIFAVAILLSLALATGVLFGVAKLFKQNLSLSNALLVVLATEAVGAGVGIIFVAFNEILAVVLALVASVATFIYVLGKKGVQVSVPKGIGIYVAYELIAALVVLVLIIPIRVFFFEPLYVQGASMDPSYVDGDYLLIKKFANEYAHGDVVVYVSPAADKSILIKRIIATPGDLLEINEGKVFLNGQELMEPYLAEGVTTGRRYEIELAENQYYVMGDNRAESFDSRAHGFIMSDAIIGEATQFKINIGQ